MPNALPRVAVFLGGPSSEHEVSLMTGRLMLKRLDRTRFAPAPVYVDRDKGWHFAAWPWQGAGEAALERLAAGPAYLPAQGGPLPWTPDLALLGLHGAYGEDGEIQTELTRLGIPYTGSGPEASRCAMNKVAAKALFRGADLPVAAEVAIAVGDAPAAVAQRVLTALRGPWVVKPRDGGSSVGVFIVDAPAALEAAIHKALLVGPALVEPFLAGRELTCGVLEDPVTLTASALPPTEIVPRVSGFFDYTAKYTPGGSEEITPAPITPGETARVQALALAAHRALGCRGYSRSDFILSKASDAPQGLILLETNTLPGMTATSLLPQAAAVVGIGYAELLTRLLTLARLR